METKTVINDKEYKHYDGFQQWVEDLKQSFINQKDYKGYPILSENAYDVFNIYDAANTEERQFIFKTLVIQFQEALRHWKVDRDLLWTENGRKEHADMIDKYKDLLPYMKKDWDKFW